MNTDFLPFFEKYLAAICDISASIKQNPPNRAIGGPIISPGLQDLRARGESTVEFKELCRAAPDPMKQYKLFKNADRLWEEKVSTFFCTSGLYNAVFEGKNVDESEAAELFRTQLAVPRGNRTYYAPIEMVEFEQTEMVFSDFTIKQFSVTELDTIFRQEVCKAFFPYSVLDTETLSSYWFIVCTATKQDWTEAMQSFGSTRVSTTDLPSAVERAFRRLILFPWNTDDTKLSELLSKKNPETWLHFRFEVPFVLWVSDSLTERPVSSPNYSKLELQPYFSPEGEEIGSGPYVGWRESFNCDGDFQAQLKYVDSLLLELSPIPKEWQFIETALTFLEKAYIRNDDEQLLWHVTTVEALLSEKSDSGATKLLYDRVSRILGAGTADTKDIRKAFEAIYDLRSRIVHGSPEIENKDILAGHLTQAREFARRLTEWMLRYLVYVKRNLKPGSSVPSRKALLSVIDLETDGRNLCSLLPPRFPSF